MSWTIRTNAFVDQWGLPLRVAINWSPSSLLTPAVHYIVSWPSSTLIWSYSYSIACCCLLLMSPVLRNFFKCASWVIFWVAAIVALRWTNWCLRWWCVSARGALDEAPIVRLDSDSTTPGWCVCGALTCCCENSEESDNEKWKVLRDI